MTEISSKRVDIFSMMFRATLANLLIEKSINEISPEMDHFIQILKNVTIPNEITIEDGANWSYWFDDSESIMAMIQLNMVDTFTECKGSVELFLSITVDAQWKVYHDEDDIRSARTLKFDLHIKEENITDRDIDKMALAVGLWIKNIYEAIINSKKSEKLLSNVRFSN